MKKTTKIVLCEDGTMECPNCNKKLDIHYNKIQILCYMCSNCDFEYPVKKQQIKLWKYGEGWWLKYDQNGKRYKRNGK